MNNFTILCVDDEKTITYSLKDQLKKYLGTSVTIETAESGDEALEILQELLDEKKDIPLVISDYLMPGMKGDELLKKIHQIDPHIYTILLTGQATLEGVTNAINNANLYRYIGKPWTKEDIELAVKQAIISYQKDKQIESQHKELEKWAYAFIETMGMTLDKRDSTTAGHSVRLATYCANLASAINFVDYGLYKDFKFTEEEIDELYFSAILHDIGKIGVREHILLKTYKLSIEKQEVLIYKFNWLKKSLEIKKNQFQLSESENIILLNIDKYLAELINISKKEYLSENDENTINIIGNIKFIDVDGTEKPLLNDFELKNLLVKKGNLTNEERELINSHAEHTYSILKGLPWPKKFKRVPEFAGGHHERLNGSGYFRGLKGDELPLQIRILGLLDVYEALTAKDRPYKKGKTHEEAMSILEKEVEMGSFDKDLFEIFKTLPKENF